jgi:hypothetical protein
MGRSAIGPRPRGCGPGPFYLGLGFEPNGEFDEGEVVLVYPLHPNAEAV